MNEPSLDPQAQNNSSFVIEHQPFNGHPVVVRLLNGDDIFCTSTIIEQVTDDIRLPLRLVMHKPMSLIPAEMGADAEFTFAPWQSFSSTANYPLDASQVLAVSPILPAFSNSYITWSERIYKALQDMVDMPMSDTPPTNEDETLVEYLRDAFVEFDVAKEQVH